MMIEESLAEEVSSHEPNGHPILEFSNLVLTMSESTRQDKCTIQLYKDYIFITVHKSKANNAETFLKVTINFDLIFQLLRNEEANSKGKKKKTGPAFGLRFERFEHSMELMCEDTANCQQILFKWRNELGQIMNQRGFHELFKPIKKIGKGNFASVYLVLKHEDGKKYAVKAFSKEGTYSEERGKQSLINQIEIMRQFKHENLMQLFEIYESQNSIYVVVELLEGGQLYDKVKAKYSFSRQEIVIVMRTLLEGLEVMHAKNIMHRDLKPENIIFRSQGQFDCVIADFGLATFADQNEYLFVRCGTPGYVAPEVVNLKNLKAKYDPICDMFSLGVILHILAMKKAPFPGRQYNEVLSQNRACNINFGADEYKKIPQSWLNLMMRMLEKNPNNRISASDALKHDFFFKSSRDPRQDSIQSITGLNSRGSLEERQTLMGRNSSQKKNSLVCESPLMTTKNNERKNPSLLRDDSCLKFKMKENIMTGRVAEDDESIDTIDSPALIKKNPKTNIESRFKKMSNQM